MDQNLLITIVTFVTTVIVVVISGKVAALDTKDVFLIIFGTISCVSIISYFWGFYFFEKEQKSLYKKIQDLNILKKFIEEKFITQELSWLYSKFQSSEVHYR